MRPKPLLLEIWKRLGGGSSWAAQLGAGWPCFALSTPGLTPWPGIPTSSSLQACSAQLFFSGTPRWVFPHPTLAPPPTLDLRFLLCLTWGELQALPCSLYHPIWRWIFLTTLIPGNGLFHSPCLQAKEKLSNINCNQRDPGPFGKNSWVLEDNP